MADPIVNDGLNEEKKNPAIAGQIGTSGVFGGGEDIFDNEELFQPIDGVDNPKIKIQNIQDEDEEKEDDINRDIDQSLLSKQGEIVSSENFDPIFTDEEDSEKPQIESEKPKEAIQEEISSEEEITSDDEDENLDEEKSDYSEQAAMPAGKASFVSEDSVVEEERDEEKSDLIKKFDELISKTKELYQITELDEGSYVELLGGDDGVKKVLYNLRWMSEDDSILISKIESNKETQEEEQNNLQMLVSEGSLQIILDETLLYDEKQDLVDDINKKMQVSEKLNKFIFLVGEELKIYERDAKEKKMMEEERRKLRDIFRNF